MRVAIFTDDDLDKVNDVTTTLRSVLRFPAADVEPRVYAASDFSIDTAEYFSAASFGVRLPWYRDTRVHWPRAGAFARQLREDGARVIHITTPGPVGLAARWLADRMQLPVTGSYHPHLGEYVTTLSGSRRIARWLDLYMRWLYGRCDPVLVPSRATRDLLWSQGYRLDRLRIWACGVDTERFAPCRASAALRAAWQVDDRRPAVIYAGSLSLEKGLDLIAPIQRRLDRERVAHQLVFVGDGPMRAELAEQCPGAVFLGAVSHDKVAVAMASADVLLFPSAPDSFVNVVLEAQASGLPVLVSNRGGLQEHLVVGTTGEIATAGDEADFANRLKALLRDTGRRREMGRAARQFVRHRDWPSALLPLFDAWRDSAHAAHVTDASSLPALERRAG